MLIQSDVDAGYTAVGGFDGWQAASHWVHQVSRIQLARSFAGDCGSCQLNSVLQQSVALNKLCSLWCSVEWCSMLHSTGCCSMLHSTGCCRCALLLVLWSSVCIPRYRLVDNDLQLRCVYGIRALLIFGSRLLHAQFECCMIHL